MAKAGVFISVVGKVDPKGFAAAEAELTKLKSQTLGTGGAMAVGLKGFQSKLDGISSKLTGFGKKMSTHVTLPVVGGFLLMGKAAADEQRNMEILDRALRQGAGATRTQVDSVERWITKTQNATGVMDDELRPALAKLVTSTGDVKGSQRDLNIALDIAARRGKSVSSVVDAMVKAHNGNVGALGRLGLATKDASGNTLTLDQILQNASRTMGGSAAAAANTTAGRFAIFKAKMHDVVEEIGARLLPIGERLIGWIGRLVSAFTSLPSWVQNIILIGAAIAAVIGPIAGIVGTVISVVGSIAGALSAVAGVVAPVIAAISAPLWVVIAIIAAVAAAAYVLYRNWDTVWSGIRSVVEAFRPAFDAVVGFIGRQINQITGWVNRNRATFEKAWNNIVAVVRFAVGVLTAHFSFLINNVYRPAFDIFVKVLLPILQGAWENIKLIVSTAIQFVQGIVQTVMALIAGDWSGAWDGIKTALGAVWDLIVGLVRNALSTVLGVLGAAWDAAFGVVRSAWDSIVGVVANGINSVITWVAGLPGRILSALGDLAGLLISSGWNLVQGLIQGLINAWPRVVNWVKDKIGSIPGLVADFLGIGSPSRYTRAHGQWLMEGLRLGMADALPATLDATETASKRILSKFELLKRKQADAARAIRTGQSATGSVSAGNRAAVIHLTIPVDARGSADRHATELAAKRGAQAGAQTALRQLTVLARGR